MTLGKTTNDNSVRFVPKSEQKRENRQNTIKSNSTPRKQKKIHETKKNSLEI